MASKINRKIYIHKHTYIAQSIQNFVLNKKIYYFIHTCFTFSAGKTIRTCAAVWKSVICICTVSTVTWVTHASISNLNKFKTEHIYAGETQ